MSEKYVKKCGFTLLEVVVSMAVFLVFIGGLYWVYSGTMNSFQANTWKQNILTRSEIFWPLLRKHLEEASDFKINNLASFDTVHTGQNLLFRCILPDSGAKSGNILCWIKTKHDLTTGVTLYESSCILSMQNRNLFFEVKTLSGSPPASDLIPKKMVMEDVDSFIVKATPLWMTEDGGEYMSPVKNASSDETSGSMIEISLVMKPPSSVAIKNLSISQNNKFKINVGAEDKSAQADISAY